MLAQKVSPVLWSSFSVPAACLNKGVKGWRRFMIADARRRLSLRPAEADERERELGQTQAAKAPGTRKRQADGSEYPPIRFTNPNQFRALQADGRRAFMPQVSHNPCLIMPILWFRPSRGGCSSFPVPRALTTPFIEQRDHHRKILITCKSKSINRDNMVNRKSAAGVGGRGRGLVSRLWGHLCSTSTGPPCRPAAWMAAQGRQLG